MTRRGMDELIQLSFILPHRESRGLDGDAADGAEGDLLLALLLKAQRK